MKKNYSYWILGDTEENCINNGQEKPKDKSVKWVKARSAKEALNRKGRPLGSKTGRKKQIVISIPQECWVLLMQKANRERRRYAAMASILIEDALKDDIPLMQIEGIL